MTHKVKSKWYRLIGRVIGIIIFVIFYAVVGNTIAIEIGPLFYLAYHLVGYLIISLALIVMMYYLAKAGVFGSLDYLQKHLFKPKPRKRPDIPCDVATRLMRLASRADWITAERVSFFDESVVIISESYSFQATPDSLEERRLYIRIHTEKSRNIIQFIRVEEMPTEPFEQIQEPVRIEGENLFSKPLHNIIHVVDQLEDIGYRFEPCEKYIATPRP